MKKQFQDREPLRPRRQRRGAGGGEGEVGNAEVNKQKMESLKQLVTNIGEHSITSPTSRKITIVTWTIRFQKWLGKPLDESQKGSYKIKPLVEIDGEPLFGKLAILRLLQKDEWDGVWADTYHDKFWKGLPDRTKPCSLPEKAKEIYDMIVTKHGRHGGFFDVIAWREQKLLFAEYKGEGDKLNQNQFLGQEISGAVKLIV